MAILNNNPLVGASGNQGGYNINNSLRFRSSASAYLNRTPASTTNRQTWTWSGWVKRGALGARQHIFVSANPVVNTSGQQEFQFAFNSSDQIEITGGVSGVGQDLNLTTTQVFRDPSAWYHFVVAIDTTQATSSNRMKFYVNGVQVTAFGTAIYPAQNHNTAVNLINFSHRIGGSGGSYLDGYLTEVNFIDGQALTPSSFGETDTTTGVWKPKAYTGTYGTNGFYLKFSDIATTSGSNAGLGKDFSGNSNYWTTNNISVTSGTTYDAMTDSPTLTSATVGNYCTINPLLDLQTYATYSEGNLKVSTTAAGGFAMRMQSKGTMAIPSSGKWYFAANASDCGIAMANDDPNRTQFGASILTTHVRYQSGGDVLLNGSVYATVASFTSTDEVGLAIDMDALTVGVYKNGSLLTTVTGVTSGFTYYPMTVVNSSSTAYTAFWNFGQRPFAYTPPTGFNRLNTFNLPTPTILQGNKNFGVLTYTGNGSTSVTRSDTNAVNFTPDFVWIKSRSSTNYHNLYDVNRIVSGDHKRLYSNDTLAEESSTYLGATNLNGFVNGGFTTGAGGDTNTNSATYVAWNWKANGSPVTNTSGSITSTVSVNATAGFSIVTYTGTGANATVGHGLGVAPRMIIFKQRNAVRGWIVYHASLANASTVIYLNVTNASNTDTTAFNATAPTSSVFSVGTSADTNQSTGTYVAYCWAEIAGFSRFGSYTGNGSTDGTFVYTGFRPEFIMFKRTNDVSDWNILDTTRSPYNTSITRLFANVSNAENSSAGNYDIDILSNGFKQRNTNTSTASNSNLNGSTYIFMAFAENPFKNSLAR